MIDPEPYTLNLLMLSLYRILTLLLTPFLTLLLRWRKAQVREHPERWREKLAQDMGARPPGSNRLVWIHAASVGEANSVLPLITLMLSRYPELSVLLTTVTLTSGKLMSERLPARAVHQFAPLDAPGIISRFLDRWQPDLALWVESEFWPNMMLETHRRHIPMLLLNARMSERSFHFWKRYPSAIKTLIGCFTSIYPQSRGDDERLHALGAEHTRIIGNLKLAVPPPSVDEVALKEWKIKLASRPCWAAASIHPGELDAIAGAQKNLDALLIAIPRHPQRGVEMASTLRARGFTVALRSRGEALGADTQIYVADTMGELGLWYRLAPVVFVGGSLIPHGGQNPLEPAYCGAAVLYGPHMFNFTAICEELEKTGAVREISAETLRENIDSLLAHQQTRAAMAAARKSLLDRHASLLENTLSALTPYLAERK